METSENNSEHEIRVRADLQVQTTEPQPEANRHKPYVGDVERPDGATDTAASKAGAGAGMVVFALIVGFVVGLVVWAVFWASTALMNLLWVDFRSWMEGALGSAGLATWWIPLLFTAVGGLAIGLWTWRFGGSPESLEKVMETVGKTGGYKLDNPVSSAVGFLLPLVFGGSIGPEAGLTGIIAAACSSIGRMLKSAGLRIRGVADLTVSAAISAVFGTPLAGIVATAEDGMPSEDGLTSADGAPSGGGAPDGTCMSDMRPGSTTQRNPDSYDFRRKAKLVLYTASAFGAIGGVVLFTSIFGSEGGIPRFDGATPGLNGLWWGIPCILIGYIGALLYHGSQTVLPWLSERMGEHPVLKPLIAGVILGLLAIPLPYVLFPGESQAYELMGCWQQIGAAGLIATGMLKCVATPLCLNFGWRGGHFFPLIFAGIAAGYGVACLSGVDPMFCVAVTTSALMAGVQRKPLMAMALLLLCFPAKDILWLGIACLVGAALPVPSAFLREGSAESGAAPSQQQQGQQS